jgi:hypothetical protein
MNSHVKRLISLSQEADEALAHAVHEDGRPALKRADLEPLSKQELLDKARQCYIALHDQEGWLNLPSAALSSDDWLEAALLRLELDTVTDVLGARLLEGLVLNSADRQRRQLAHDIGNAVIEEHLAQLLAEQRYRLELWKNKDWRTLHERGWLDYEDFPELCDDDAGGKDRDDHTAVTGDASAPSNAESQTPPENPPDDYGLADDGFLDAPPPETPTLSDEEFLRRLGKTHGVRERP